MNPSQILNQPLFTLIRDHPYLHDFFDTLGFQPPRDDTSVQAFIHLLPEDGLADLGLDKESLLVQMIEFMDKMEAYQQQGRPLISRLTIQAGFDKSGNREPMGVDLHPGQVVSVVGPTGSGKSQLLADIECLAQADTPSGRIILLDGEKPDHATRFSGEIQLVAQLSQNMNFVMDLTVASFLTLHAQSRLVENVPARIARVFEEAVGLTGEPFDMDTPVTALSGGQSRALMIADVAFLSASPVVLIDEIENAGVDRGKALALLVKKEKLVILATHDPMLALWAQQRIVIRNGGIADVIETSADEKKTAAWLSGLDEKMARLRERVRQGERLGFDLDALSLFPEKKGAPKGGKPALDS